MTHHTEQKRRILRIDQRGAGIISAIISIIFGFIVVVLAFRFFFRLLGANPGHEFVTWIYDVSGPFVSPFMGIFHGSTNLGTGRFEFETLIALVVYGIVGSLVSGLANWGGRNHRGN